MSDEWDFLDEDLRTKSTVPSAVVEGADEWGYLDQPDIGAGQVKTSELQKAYEVAGTMPEPEKERDMINDAWLMAKPLDILASEAYENHDLYLEEAEKHEVKLKGGPFGAFWKATWASLPRKELTYLKGWRLNTPGFLDPIMDPQYNMWMKFFDKRIDPALEEEVAELLNAPLMPSQTGDKWYQRDLTEIPAVLNTWAAQVGDQVPILLHVGLGSVAAEVAGRAAGPAYKPVKTAMGMAVGGTYSIALETGGFWDYAQALGIDKDLAEKYARLYGVSAGPIEYSQNVFALAPIAGMMSKVSKPFAKITKRKALMFVARELGGAGMEGVEEFTQNTLEKVYIGLAIDEMKSRDPGWNVAKPDVFEGGLRAFMIGTGVYTITRGLGHITRATYDTLSPTEKRKVDKYQVKIEGEPSFRGAGATGGFGAPEGVGREDIPLAKIETGVEVTPDVTRGEIFYRGTVPGETKRIEPLFPSAEGGMFVAKKRESARLYGESIEEIEAKPEAKILHEGSPEYKKLTHRRSDDIYTHLRAGETLIEAVDSVIKIAKEQGYDAVSFNRDSDIGTVILNENAFIRQAPKEVKPKPDEIAKLEKKIEDVKYRTEVAMGKAKVSDIIYDEVSESEVEEYAKVLKDVATQEYESFKGEDLLTRVTERGKIYIGDWKGTEEINEIPAKVRAKVFTADPTFRSLDEAADTLGMTENELLQELQVYEELAIPGPMREYLVEARQELSEDKEAFIRLKKAAEVAGKKIEEMARTAVVAGKRIGKEAERERKAEVEAKAKVRKSTRDHIKKMVSDIKKVSKETDYMSPAQAEPIKQLVDNIDFVKHRKKTILNLEKIRNYLEGNPDAEMPSYIIEKLKTLEHRDMNDITLEELENIHDAVMHYAQLHKLKKTLRVGRERRKFSEALAQSIEEMKPTKKVVSTIVQSGKGAFGRIKDTGQLIKSTFGVRHNHYDLIVESISGPNSVSDKVLYQGVKDGITKQIKYKQDVYKERTTAIEQIMEKRDIKDIVRWKGERVLIGKFNLTRGERMALYRHSLNENNIRHLIGGKGSGFSLKDVAAEGKYKVNKITKGQIGEIVRSLSKAEKEYADLDTLFIAQGKALADTFYQKNHYSLRLEDKYYPIEVMRTALEEEQEAKSILEELKHQWIRVGISKGMLERRVKSKLPIYLNDIDYDLNRSILHAAAYVGLEIPLSNASKLLYNNTYKANMIQRYGETTWKEIGQGLRDIAGEYKSYTDTERLLLKVKNKLTPAFLGANPFVWMIQPLSHAAYSAYVKPKYMMMGMVDYIVHGKSVLERHKLYSPEFLERKEAGYSRDVSDVFKKGAEKRLYKGKKTLQELMLSPIKWFDQHAVAPGMQGAILQVLAEVKEGRLSRETKIALDIEDSAIVGLTPMEQMNLAYKYADYATERTQPMFRPEHQAPLQRGTPLEKLFTQFGSFTNQALNLIRRSWRDVQRTKDPLAYKKMAMVLFSLGVVNTLGIMGRDELRDWLYGRDTKDKSWVGRIAKSWAGYFFFIRDIANSLVSYVERGPFLGYDVSIPIMAPINLFVRVATNGIAALTETSNRRQEKAAMQALDDTIELLLMSQGLPYEAPKKTVKGVIEKIEGR